jgi:CheY-like chemotaxis protein
VGFTVLVALNGESAFEQLEQTKPDLILLDVIMPNLDGFETCARLESQCRYQKFSRDFHDGAV